MAAFRMAAGMQGLAIAAGIGAAISSITTAQSTGWIRVFSSITTSPNLRMRAFV